MELLLMVVLDHFLLVVLVELERPKEYRSPERHLLLTCNSFGLLDDRLGGLRRDQAGKDFALTFGIQHLCTLALV